MRESSNSNNWIDGRVLEQRIRKDLPLIPGETVLPELARLPLVLRIIRVQQVGPDFRVLHVGEGSVRQQAQTVKSPACNVTTAWNGRSNSTS